MQHVHSLPLRKSNSFHHCHRQSVIKARDFSQSAILHFSGRWSKCLNRLSVILLLCLVMCVLNGILIPNRKFCIIDLKLYRLRKEIDCLFKNEGSLKHSSKWMKDAVQHRYSICLPILLAIQKELSYCFYVGWREGNLPLLILNLIIKSLITLIEYTY